MMLCIGQVIIGIIEEMGVIFVARAGDSRDGPARHVQLRLRVHKRMCKMSPSLHGGRLKPYHHECCEMKITLNNGRGIGGHRSTRAGSKSRWANNSKRWLPGSSPDLWCWLEAGGRKTCAKRPPNDKQAFQ